MPAKKVAKKAAKKVAKKAAKKGARHQGNDLRRSYEHLHRVHVLHRRLNAESLAQVDTLTRAAQAALANEDEKTAADLLRATEHLAFGSLALDREDTSANEALSDAARFEYEHLTARAAERWAEQDRTSPRGAAGIYKFMLQAAKAAMEKGALHRALEFARGAEALSHARPVVSRLPGTQQRQRLRP